ncbi:hypothetical protein [Amycolatopsis sp. 195334CR]|uniref:hypothetical protein n=1 Tax=Amycolatopsis sp. 195334CR TaxID=2814588 RepID=UPI001A8CDFB1|nr:hypothetical protein [Amycolatopsis sp. 195334CR]MBN6039628.1 hypothetical protein [Amycolatopsis sp. 195334CR]
MARRYVVISEAEPDEELVFRPVLREVAGQTWLLGLLGAGIGLVILAIVVVAAEFHLVAWLVVAVLATGSAGGLVWRLLVAGTTADAEGLTTVRVRTVDLSWSEVQGLRLTSKAVLAYDSAGGGHPLYHVPPTRRALADLKKLWLAGRGPEWTQSVTLPEAERPVGKHYRTQDPNAPEPVRFTTGLGTGFGMAALFTFVALYIYTDLDEFDGWFETAEPTMRETIVTLLCFIGAPVVGFTYGLSMTRKKRREEYEEYVARHRSLARLHR